YKGKGMITAAKIFSTLGNSQSLVPLAVKDCANGAGMTAASSVTSKDEGVDRFIDEFGSEVIWLGGIPLYKKITDKTLFKIAKLDADYDVRNLKNNDIYEKTKEWAPDKKVKEGIEEIGANKKLFKNLNVVKFVASTLLALGTYNVMTDLKQQYTRKKIKKKLLKQEEEKSIILMNTQGDSYHKTTDLNFQNLSKIRSKKDKNTNNSTNPNFTGLYSVMLDPVKNMCVLDVGITSERLAKSRSPQEFAGYAIKEAGFLAFMYYLGQKVQSHFENVADKKHNKSIALDARVLENETFEQAFADRSIEKSLNLFPKNASDVELYDFVNKTPENMVVDAAKQSDIIQTYKKSGKWYQIFKKSVDTGKIDTRKYINLDDIRNTHSNISKLYEQYNQSGETIEEFFKSVRKLKRGSIVKNIGSTIFALGVVLPSIMLADRFLKPENKEFAVEKELKEQIRKEKSQPKIA
ncbi:MAG: hypothetical protein LUB59_01170, partial [Candidatus Gastranaerophilales bacterium]|nr:hypothetical protein [Candidatus Gastranaerophilales bacterium]